MKTQWKNPPDEHKTHSFDDESFCLISNSWKLDDESEILCVGFFVLHFFEQEEIISMVFSI